jgi:signal transduction histidine kinase
MLPELHYACDFMIHKLNNLRIYQEIENNVTTNNLELRSFHATSEDTMFKDYFDNIVQTFQPIIKERDIHLQINYNANDNIKWENVFVNLNKVKFDCVMNTLLFNAIQVLSANKQQIRIDLNLSHYADAIERICTSPRDLAFPSVEHHHHNHRKGRKKYLHISVTDSGPILSTVSIYTALELFYKWY